MAEQAVTPPDDSRSQLRAAMRDKVDAETRKLLAEAAEAEAKAEIARIGLERTREQRLEELAGNKYHHVYLFEGQVNLDTVDRCIRQLTIWMRNEPGCPIDVIFKSPGGDVIQGMALYDFIQELRARGHYITTLALGWAASMAGILLQAGDKRVIGREAYVLIHEISSGAIGKIGEMEDELKFLKKIQARILDIFAKRAKVSRGYFAKNWRRKDWWLDSDECLKIGFVDEVR